METEITDYFPTPDTVYLDVGGRIFKTNKKTLMNSRLFEAMLSEDSGSYKSICKGNTKENAIFIDRDPVHFAWILNMLHTGNTVGFKKEYLPDLDFFMIDYKELFLASLYEPFDLVDKEIKEESNTTEQENLELTEEQQKVIDAIEIFLKDINQPQWFHFSGHAGCGKTYCLSYFLKKCISNNLEAKYNISNTTVSAPTHKAVRVIKNKIGKPGIKCSTIHKLLCLEKDVNEHGEVKFIQNDGYLKVFSVVRLVVIDECSMISEELYDILVKMLHEFPKLKIIFTGDPAQLPPINEPLSKIFIKFQPNISLSTVVRHGGGILNTATLVRSEPDKQRHNFIETENVRFLLMEEEWFNAICYCFKQNKDAHVLSWTNKRTNEINKVIRDSIYGSEEASKSEFLPNEKCIATDYFEVGKFVFRTSDEITIINSIVTEVSYTNFNFRISNLVLKVYRLTLNEELHILRVHKDSLELYEKTIKKMYSRAKAAKRVSKERAIQLWKQFFTFKHKYNSPITYNYSTTCHKAQGSTYDIVFIEHNDITKNRDTVYMNKCLYTAITRAAKLIVFFM